MQLSIRRSLDLAGTAALTLAAAPGFAEPAKVAQGTAADLGVTQVSLKDAVQFNWGFQGQTQGAGTPNELGIGGFLPLAVGTNSVAFLDVLANANLADIGNYSSIINTKVAGTTISTSTRLGYRWLNSNRSWMFGVNAGYDSRPMATGQPDTGITVTNSQTVLFQQVAANLEAVSNSWNFNAYALVPVGTRVDDLNSVYNGGSLQTYGLDASPQSSRLLLVTTTKTATSIPPMVQVCLAGLPTTSAMGSRLVSTSPTTKPLILGSQLTSNTALAPMDTAHPKRRSLQ